jgi:homospermidine synthase
MTHANAYEAGAKTAVTNRELEATALFKAARKLEACLQGWDGPEHAAQLDEALRYNLRLWTLFQCELARPGRESSGSCAVTCCGSRRSSTSGRSRSWPRPTPSCCRR